MLKTNPDRHSALDFVVLVDDYRRFYQGLATRRELHRPVFLMTGMASLLPPNVIAFAPDEGRRGIAKCLVVDSAHFEHALGDRPRDHFLLGRMVQRVGVVWTRDPEDEVWATSLLRAAHDGVLGWMAPYLEGTFDAADLGRRLLEVCYRGELRPESKGRSAAIFEAQADHFGTVLQPGIDRALDSGLVVPEGEGVRLAAPADSASSRYWRRHFRRSKARATLRWFKHMFTFANWLPYVVRKVERHTGRTIRLTLLERKLPLLFLWPRAIHVLLTRPKKELRS
ncbi:MAG: hypothetical protein AAF389_18145 [Gemmatimonadota bacterium]